MKKLGLLIIALFVLTFDGFSQATFTAVANGNWTDGATWGNASPGTVGVDFPGALDDAYTAGFSITVTAGSTCKNLAVSYNVAGSLTGASQLTITGTMSGWD